MVKRYKHGVHIRNGVNTVQKNGNKNDVPSVNTTCYAFDCVVCKFVNTGPASIDWKVGVDNVDSLRCGGCGAGAFEMVVN
jgi:hypothetical protein